MDFNSAIKPLIIVSRIFGLAPFSIDQTGYSVSYRKSKTATAYSIIWCVIFILGMNIAMTFFQQTVKLHQSPIMATAGMFRAACSFSSFAYSHVICFFYRDKIIHIFAEITSLGDAFDIAPHQYKKYRNFIVVQELVTSIIVLLIFGGASAEEELFTISKLPLLVIFFSAVVTNLIPEFQFNNLAFMLGMLFEAFHKKLDDIGEDSAKMGFSSKTILAVNTNSRSGMERGRSSISVVSFQSEEDLLRRNLDPKLIEVESIHGLDLSRNRQVIFDAAKLHRSLHSILEMVNSIFGVQNMLALSFIFLETMISLYTTFYVLIEFDEKKENIFLALETNLVYVFLGLARLIFMVTTCSLTLSQSEELARTVSRLQSNATTSRYREQMQALSLQILHHKVRFSACGLFPIDATLITSIIGCVATYLVIVIQMAPLQSNTMTTTSP